MAISTQTNVLKKYQSLLKKKKEVPVKFGASCKSFKCHYFATVVLCLLLLLFKSSHADYVIFELVIIRLVC